MRLILVVSFFIHFTNGFYVPGIAPTEFAKGSRIGENIDDVGKDSENKFPIPSSEVKAVKMTSTRTQLPYDYYSLNFCLPKNGALHYKSENLGEVLRGKIRKKQLNHIFITFYVNFQVIE